MDMDSIVIGASIMTGLIALVDWLNLLSFASMTALIWAFAFGYLTMDFIAKKRKK